MTRPLRILLIAEQANPDWVSVPLEGWCLYEALARVADVHLVTHVRNEENILKSGLPRERFTALDNRKVERLVLGLANLLRGTSDPGGVGQTTVTAFSSLAYYRFEQQLWRLFGGRIRAGEFDLVHRVTPLSAVLPSIIAPRCARAGVPFVFGPLNGGLPWPPGFTRERHREKEWLSYVRAAHRLLPGYTSTRRRAAALIAGSTATLEQIPARYRDRCVYIPENGVVPARFPEPALGPVTLPLRVAFVGRMVPYKMPGLLLEAALPFLREGKVQLEYLGDGPELASLKSRAAAEGVTQAITFAGWVEHATVKQRLSQAHVFGFPSIREFGGAVVLEAMASGLVPIVVAYGGPGEHVSPQTGFAVPLGTPEQIVAGIRGALAQLLADPSAIRPMGLRARARVMAKFTWDAKAAQVMAVYRWVLKQGDKPEFGMPFADDAPAVPDARAVP